MADKYRCFQELAANHRDGVDFAIDETSGTDQFLCVIAPHAGRIEFQTGELAREIAGKRFPCYVFEGIMAKGNHEYLHLTSHNFDEPRALRLLASCQTALGVHGRKDCAKVNGTKNLDKDRIFLGGLVQVFINCLERMLVDQGFTALKDGHKFGATHCNNVCNRSTSRKGAQIELPASLRRQLRDEVNLRRRFLDAIDAAIDMVNDGRRKLE